MSVIEERLAALGISVPAPKAPVANYVPYVLTGSMLHISGQVSVADDSALKGVVGVEVDLETAQRGARMCAINLIAQMKQACGGDLARVRRVVKLNGFVQAGPDFFDIPKVIDGASNLMVEAFAEAGRHARSAVGVYRLPLNFSVEVDALVEIA